MLGKRVEWKCVVKLPLNAPKNNWLQSMFEIKSHSAIYLRLLKSAFFGESSALRVTHSSQWLMNLITNSNPNYFTSIWPQKQCHNGTVINYTPRRTVPWKKSSLQSWHSSCSRSFFLSLALYLLWLTLASSCSLFAWQTYPPMLRSTSTLRLLLLLLSPWVS